MRRSLTILLILFAAAAYTPLRAQSLDAFKERLAAPVASDAAFGTAKVAVTECGDAARAVNEASRAGARLRFPGRQVFFGLFVSSMMIPSVVLFIPNFILIKDLGWMNTMAGMVAPFCLMSGFSVFFLKESLTWNHAIGFALIAIGASFVFRA